MKGKICFCPSSIRWIVKNLKPKSIRRFLQMTGNETPLGDLKIRRKKRRSAKQIRATKKLIAFNKRRRARR